MVQRTYDEWLKTFDVAYDESLLATTRTSYVMTCNVGHTYDVVLYDIVGQDLRYCTSHRYYTMS
jgi:hypothetical protein